MITLGIRLIGRPHQATDTRRRKSHENDTPYFHPDCFVRGRICGVWAQPPTAARLPIAYSTLACPAWDFTKVLDFATQNGFAAVELRGLQGSMDLPSHPVFAPDRIKDTLQQIKSHDLKIACVSSSTEVGEPGADKRTKGIVDARRFIDLASQLNAPYIRVFGKSSDSAKPVTPDAELKKRVSDGLHELGEYAGTKNVTVLIESHDDFTAAAALKEVLS